MEIWAHRGWRSRHPDNTALAIGAAFGVVDTVEVDVRRTRDGLLALSHDPELAGHVVADTDWSVLRTLDLGQGQRAVLLEEALAMFPDRRFDIEVKNSPFEPGYEPDGGIVADAIARARPGDLVTSFHWPSLDRCVDAAAARGASTGLLIDLDVPVEDVVEHAARYGHTGVAPSYFRLDAWGMASAVRSFHEVGCRVAVWTVNDAEAAQRLEAGGVDAIITDDPGYILGAVD